MSASKDLKRRIQTQNMIIIALAIIIVVLVVVSSTAAWYIRTKSDSADIILSNPVNIYITEFEELKDGTGNVVTGEDGEPIKIHTLKTDILENYNTRVYPGDKIKMRLGMQIGSQEVEASPAYVRVKLVITYENIINGETSGLEILAKDNLIEYKDKPDEDNWELVNFNQYSQISNPELEDDYWYVLKTTNAGQTVAKVAYNLDTYEFIDGYIELNKLEITNEHANCLFHINYVVEAIQYANVPDPLVYQGYGPWWNFALGDIEDVGA